MGWIALVLLSYLVLLVHSDNYACPTPSAMDALDPSNYCSEKLLRGTLKRGSLCLSRPEYLTPTQMFVGKLEADCTRRKMEAMSDVALKEDLMDNVVPVVIGPGGKLYIVDHHHYAHSLFRASLSFNRPLIHRTLYVCVQLDYSSKNTSDFWDTMTAQSLTYLYDEFGHPITYPDLPSHIKDLHDNPYRSLASWVRKSFGYIKCGTKGTKNVPICQKNDTAPFFLECLWGNFIMKKFTFRNFVEEPTIRPLLDEFIFEANQQSQAAAMAYYLPDIITYCTSSAASRMPGYNNNYLPAKPVNIDSNGCIE